MNIQINCPRCDETISAEDEDELVDLVQKHVSKEHDLPVTLPRKHILARLREHRGSQAEDV